MMTTAMAAGITTAIMGVIMIMTDVGVTAMTTAVMAVAITATAMMTD